MSGTTFYKDSLARELSKRCERNPRYSIRSFARALGVDPGALSRILSGKQIPSLKLAKKIFNLLDFSPAEQQRFLASIADAQRARGAQRINPIVRNYQTERPAPADLSIDIYKAISDWYHAAIMELTFVEQFESSPKWISQELGISEAEAKLAVDRLLRLELLTNEDGRLRKTNEQLTTADKHITTPAHRKNQRQFLEKAIDSLDNDPIEERSITSMTMAIDESKLPEAKALIRQFNRSLCALLETGERKRVFNLEIALYPIQKKSKEKRK